MRKRTADNSSLELLLDTMCNTFGGVMFIAIALLVVLSMLKKTPALLTTVSEEEIIKLQLILDELQEKLHQNQRLLASKRQQVQQAEQDPREKRWRELLQLQQILANINHQEQLAEAQATLLQVESTALKQRLRETQQAISKLQDEGAALRQDIANINAELAIVLKKNTAAGGTLHFKQIAPSDKPPYFIVVRQARFWRIGPDRSADGSLLPNAAVDSDRTGDVVSCTLLQNSSEPLLAGDELSAELQQLFADLPANRCPLFNVESDSAREFSLVRELLKKANLEHGWSIHDSGESFSYMFSATAEYEY